MTELVNKMIPSLSLQEGVIDSRKIDETTGGPWIHLPQVIVDLILIYVGEIDTCAILQMTSKTVFQPTEMVYQFLCYHTYLQQTVKQSCQLNTRWLTWYDMILNRPRLRTNGFYTLKTTFMKSYTNDAFWEEKRYDSIEINYYRHLRFYNNGRVLYTLDILTPQEMTKSLKNGQAIPKKLYIGQYRLKKNKILIEIPLPYCYMNFECLLFHSRNLYDPTHPEYAYYVTPEEKKQYCGNFNVLKLIAHYSKPITGPAGLFVETTAAAAATSQMNHAQTVAAAAGAVGNVQAEENPQQPAIVHYPIPPHNYFYFQRRWDFTG